MRCGSSSERPRTAPAEAAAPHRCSRWLPRMRQEPPSPIAVSNMPGSKRDRSQTSGCTRSTTRDSMPARMRRSSLFWSCSEERSATVTRAPQSSELDCEAAGPGAPASSTCCPGSDEAAQYSVWMARLNPTAQCVHRGSASTQPKTTLGEIATDRATARHVSCGRQACSSMNATIS